MSYRALKYQSKPARWRSGKGQRTAPDVAQKSQQWTELQTAH